MRFEWNDGHVNVIGHTADEVDVGEIGLRCELLNRHDTHTQTLMPLDVPAIIVVAPARAHFSDSADLDAVRAFRLEPLDAVHLWVGTWHWGPYPAAGPSVRLFNVQGHGYPTRQQRCTVLRAVRRFFRSGCPREWLLGRRRSGRLRRSADTTGAALRRSLATVRALPARSDAPREQHHQRDSRENDRFDRLVAQRLPPSAAPSPGGPSRGRGECAE